MVTTAADRFVIRPPLPAYLCPEVRGTMSDREAAALEELACRCACPRNCKVDRLANQTKVCNTGRYARVASAFPHFGEEDCLRGWRGSATIFFSTLRPALRLLPELGHLPAGGSVAFR